MQATSIAIERRVSGGYDFHMNSRVHSPNLWTYKKSSPIRHFRSPLFQIIADSTARS
jgi:hypothetical protein